MPQNRVHAVSTPTAPAHQNSPAGRRTTSGGGCFEAACLESTLAFVAAVDAKDPYARAHSLIVAQYAGMIGRRLGLDEATLATVRSAALLHDIGKIGVPDAILTKPGPLTDAEFTVMKRHPQTAVDILADVSYLENERPMILHHHERFDGRGYPWGLSGEAIPLGARIVAMADALDAMFSRRAYKPPYGARRVRTEVQDQIGRQFDPDVANVTLRWLDELPTDVAPGTAAQREVSGELSFACKASGGSGSVA